MRSLVVTEWLFHDLRSTLRQLVGPKSPEFFFGNIKQMEEDPSITWRWRNTFGATFQFKGLLNVGNSIRRDTVAIDHIVRNNFVYQKRGVAVSANNRLAGEGLLGVEGEAHKRQNPAFGTAQIRSLMGVFLDKSVEVNETCEMWWTRTIGDGSKPKRIDVLDWLSRDDIGRHWFDSLNPNSAPNEVLKTFNKLLHSPGSARQNLIRISIPLLRFLAAQRCSPWENRLLIDGKAAINAGGGPKAVSGSRDLFSLILRANMSADVPDAHRMSDSEVVCPSHPEFWHRLLNVRSSAISWALHELSMHQAQTDTPTLEELNLAPTLRIHPPVSHVVRMATADDVLPLGTPCLDIHGRKLTSLAIRKGQTIRIPIADVNTDITLWGEDAAEFKPERWTQLPKAVETIPATWGNMLTFLAGPHNCHRIPVLAGRKALLFVLIRAFQFESVFAAGEVRRSPYVYSEREKGSQMPLMVKAYQA
ncbi:cytochrome P450 [Mycena olivaceomarginata]|nr:cytochrome P450 [Mycena olivaceomarginata]